MLTLDLNALKFLINRPILTKFSKNVTALEAIPISRPTFKFRTIDKPLATWWMYIHTHVHVQSFVQK